MEVLETKERSESKEHAFFRFLLEFRLFLVRSEKEMSLLEYFLQEKQ